MVVPGYLHCSWKSIKAYTMHWLAYKKQSVGTGRHETSSLSVVCSHPETSQADKTEQLLTGGFCTEWDAVNSARKGKNVKGAPEWRNVDCTLAVKIQDPWVHSHWIHFPSSCFVAPCRHQLLLPRREDSLLPWTRGLCRTLSKNVSFYFNGLSGIVFTPIILKMEK